MYCINCGKKIPDGYKFCPNCGTPVEEIEDQEKEPVEVKEEVQKPEKKNHKWVWILVILLVVAGISGAGTWFYLNHNKGSVQTEKTSSVAETAKPEKTKNSDASATKESAEPEDTEQKSSVLKDQPAPSAPASVSNKKTRMIFAGKSWKTVYLQYLKAINSSDSSFGSLKNVSSDQLAVFRQKYGSVNGKFTFENQWLKLDQDSYSETDQGNGNYSVTFHTYAYNLCTDRSSGEVSDNYVKLQITMTINPEKGTYTLTQQKSDKDYAFSSNMQDITSE